MLTAVIVMLVADGMVAGAVYRPLVEMVPVTAEPPVTPLTCQETAVFVVPATVAVNCVVVPRRVEEAPETLTVICGVELAEDDPLELQPPIQPMEKVTARARPQRARMRAE